VWKADCGRSGLSVACGDIWKKGKMQNLSLDCLLSSRFYRGMPFSNRYLAVGYGRIVLGRIRQQVERIRAVERVNIVIGVILIAFPHEKTVFSPTARPRRVNPEQNIVAGTLVLKQIHLMIVR